MNREATEFFGYLSIMNQLKSYISRTPWQRYTRRVLRKQYRKKKRGRTIKKYLDAMTSDIDKDLKYVKSSTTYITDEDHFVKKWNKFIFN